MSQPKSGLRILIIGVCLVLFAAGCRSPGKPDEARFASVDFPANSPAQIRDAAIEVFGKQGYETRANSFKNLVFEKKASGMSNFAYGNWMESSVWVRVKAEIVPLPGTGFRLECHAFMLRDHGSTAFEEEVKLANIQGRPYQKLLDEVAKKLNAQQVGTPP